jgi:cell division protein FtsW
MLLGVGMAGVMLLIKIEPYRMKRITSFLDPFADAQDTGLQAVQGLYALSTGGWWGVGLGASRAKWGALPEAHNDFIFAIIGEELGVIGCFLVIGLFCVLAYTGLRIARRVTDPFARLVSAACTVWLVGQAFINMGAVVGILPITGIPLPLISAGGSSLVLTMFVIGMLASFARSEPDAVAALHARGRTKWAKLLGIPLPPRPPRGDTDGTKTKKASAAKVTPSERNTPRPARPVGGPVPRQRAGSATGSGS